MSIYENVAYGPRIHCRQNGTNLDQTVKRHLLEAGLWEEVHDRLREPASQLSTGQQQRLCLARALAVEPEVLLCDEPTGNLDPVNREHVLDILFDYVDRNHTTLLTVTHDHGLLPRFDETVDFTRFHKPSEDRT